MPLHKKVLKYRRASVENEVRSSNSSQEHRAIFEAIAAHDAPLAESRMMAHIANAKAFIESKGE
jgi:DNA-binding GntR family transcriptional regulator